ncbi:MAG: 16S rRNA (guanine(527)-N(7))-methyltransferase RsmG [Bacteroidales bacterium]|jgi:16S rRNA (guanine527-N7)-methyltransferase|nr:16S rRNA (guanine(527)-N(7))-methyltransferase RsmG [Bacteroidales bacterium]
MEMIKKFFPELSKEQLEQLSKLFGLYTYWNERINLISRKDIEHLEVRHILHSLAIAKIIQFRPGTKVFDVGTGGGFPGIPLAILFPEVEFTLVDSIGKKIRVVQEVVDALQLGNVKALQIRAEQLDDEFDFIVSRAVTRLPAFISWVRDKVKAENFNSLNNGILYLKGGDIEEELNSIRFPYAVYDLDIDLPLEFFNTKKLVYISLSGVVNK